LDTINDVYLSMTNCVIVPKKFSDNLPYPSNILIWY
jgi:hypothetical protein